MDGMTLRDYFAGQALLGLVMANENPDQALGWQAAGRRDAQPTYTPTRCSRRERKPVVDGLPTSYQYDSSRAASGSPLEQQQRRRVPVGWLSGMGADATPFYARWLVSDCSAALRSCSLMASAAAVPASRPASAACSGVASPLSVIGTVMEPMVMVVPAPCYLSACRRWHRPDRERIGDRLELRLGRLELRLGRPEIIALDAAIAPLPGPPLILVVVTRPAAPRHRRRRRSGPVAPGDPRRLHPRPRRRTP